MSRCDHCLLEFPDRDAVCDEVGGRRRTFCCHGCRGIYRLIHEEGLSRFYQRRTREGAPPLPAPAAGAAASSLFAGSIRQAGGRCELDLVIDGIRCASCVWLNERMLEKIPGIDRASVSYATGRTRVRWDPGRVSLEQILRRIESIGYRPRPWSESGQFRERRAERRDLLIRFGTAGFVSAQLMMLSTALYTGYFQGIDAATKRTFEVIALLLTLPVLLYAGRPFFTGAIRSLVRLQFTMDSLVAIGTGAAFAFSICSMFAGGEVYFDTSAMIVTLVLLGRLVETTARGKASETAARLAELRPREARTVDADGRRRVVPLESVKPGDLVEVVPGERIPLDGTVRSGASEADESLVTGEVRPVPKGTGDPVIGGSTNLYGSFVFQVTGTGEKSVLAGIIRAVEEAQAGRPKIQGIADRVVGYVVPAVLVLALTALVFHLSQGAPVNRAVMAGISVLVIACPCSLGLATPLALVMFASVAAAKGILIKNADTVENADQTGHVVFDKTGTLTAGRPLLRETVVLDPALRSDEVIAIAGAAEEKSEHSIGRAIAAATKALPSVPPVVSGFRAMPGRGVAADVGTRKVAIGNSDWLEENGIPVSGRADLPDIVESCEKDGDTAVYVGWGGSLRAILIVSDRLRDEAAAAVKNLMTMNCAVSIVSGDNDRTTRAVARRAGIGHTLSGVDPVGKRKFIQRMEEQGTRVMMVGDGINDAPALVQATTGVAMGRGSDIAVEGAGVVLIRDDLLLVPECIRLSRRTFRIVRQNIFWVFFYNVISIPLAFSGLLHPIVAAGAMAASSLFVIGNSLRIGRMRAALPPKKAGAWESLLGSSGPRAVAGLSAEPLSRPDGRIPSMP